MDGTGGPALRAARDRWPRRKSTPLGCGSNSIRRRTWRTTPVTFSLRG